MGAIDLQAWCIVDVELMHVAVRGSNSATATATTSKGGSRGYDVMMESIPAIAAMEHRGAMTPGR